MHQAQKQKLTNSRVCWSSPYLTRSLKSGFSQGFFQKQIVHITINSPNGHRSTIAPFQQSPSKFQISWWPQQTLLYNRPPHFQQLWFKFQTSWQLWPKLWMTRLKYSMCRYQKGTMVARDTYSLTPWIQAKLCEIRDILITVITKLDDLEIEWFHESEPRRENTSQAMEGLIPAMVWINQVIIVLFLAPEFFFTILTSSN